MPATTRSTDRCRPCERNPSTETVPHGPSYSVGGSGYVGSLYPDILCFRRSAAGPCGARCLRRFGVRSSRGVRTGRERSIVKLHKCRAPGALAASSYSSRGDGNADRTRRYRRESASHLALFAGVARYHGRVFRRPSSIQSREQLRGARIRLGRSSVWCPPVGEWQPFSLTPTLARWAREPVVRVSPTRTLPLRRAC